MLAILGPVFRGPVLCWAESAEREPAMEEGLRLKRIEAGKEQNETRSTSSISLKGRFWIGRGG